jgi:type I restriction enzyme M protein
LNIEAIDQFVEDSTMVRNNNKKKFIVPNSLLVAKVGSHLYPTIYKEKSLALASSSVYNIQVDDHKVLIEFLAIQLNEVYVQDQLNMTRAGTSQPFTKIDDFLNIQIWVPTIEEQQKIVNKTLYDIIKADKSLEKPDEDIEKKVVEVLKHEFGNLNNPLKEYLKNIKRYIEGRVEIKIEKISSRPDAQSLEEVFDILENISNEMSTIIDDIFETFSTTQQQKESITVKGFFNAVKLNLKSIDINLFINVDRSISSHHLIEVDKMQLIKAFRNLAINAAKHGYPEGEKDKNMLIKASVSEDGQMLQIDVINDGSPFPDEFTFNDYVTLGKKTGDKKGSGIGGFLINRIISAHSGAFSQVDLTNGSIV